MSNVQKALNAAVAWLEEMYGEEERKQALALCKAALAEIEKCEPVAWQFYQDGKWHNGMDTNNHKQNTIDAGFPVRDLYTSPQPIEKCEPVGELILDPVFLPALKAPLVNWKINLVDLEVGTKLYTSPQPKELVGLSYEFKQKLHKEHHLYIPTIELIESACKQLNTKG